MGDKMINIAIDGPAGAGKSTVAKMLANKLGKNYKYVDSGAVYRALTWQAINTGVDLTNESEIVELTKNTELGFDLSNNITIDGKSLIDEIRLPIVSANVSQLAAYAGVREQLLRFFKKIAKCGGVVMDGRDIGTHVIPEAEVKIFLTADLKKRAERRLKELNEKHLMVELNELIKDIEIRDKKDQERASAPLVQAADAILLDTTDMSLDEVVLFVYNLVIKKAT